jgi:hypothetical protein
VQADGRIEYGFSDWSGGRHIGVTGFAKKQGDVWISSRNVTPGSPDSGCLLTIEFNTAGVTRVKADPLATCRSDEFSNQPSTPDPQVGVYSGGQGTVVDAVFPRRTMLGPVTTELDDLVEFFEEPDGLALKCR